MLTNRDQEAFQETGMVPFDRLRALKHALLSRSEDARTAAAADPDQDAQAAAALRGKKIAYREAAEMVQRIMDGAGLRPARYSTARRLARKYYERRAMRRSGGRS